MQLAYVKSYEAIHYQLSLDTWANNAALYF